MTAAELDSALNHVRRSPADRGRVELLVRHHRAEGEGHLDVAEGLVGDKRRSNPERQITIMNARVIELLAGERDRWALAGDQLFVDLDLSVTNVSPGTRLRIGAVVLEVTAPPHRGCSKFAARFGADALDLVNSPAGLQLNLRGIHARVVHGGAIRVGEVIEKVTASVLEPRHVSRDI